MVLSQYCKANHKEDKKMIYSKKFCIVNYSDGKFLRGTKRMKESLIKCGYTGDFLLFSESDKSRFPSHDDSPWAFKPLAIREAFNRGYEYVLWLDSSMICIRNPRRIFSKIICNGYYFVTQKSDSFGEWCSDYALSELGINREQSFSFEELNAAIVGFNKSNKKACNILDEWCSFALKGKAFRGLPKEYNLYETFNNNNRQCSSDIRVKGHRHDQTVLSYLVWKNHCKTSYIEIKNIQSTNKNGDSVYTKAISFAVCMVQNRDIKYDNYLLNYSKWGNNHGIKKIIFIIMSIIETIRNCFL